MKLKEALQKFWHLLWKDESWKGWIFSIIFLFVFIKFIFFPILSFIAGTSLPLAIVESCSMYHSGNLFSNYDLWWENHQSKYFEFNITKQEFSQFKFSNGFNKGDILFIAGVKPENIKIGDIIIFNANYQNPLIHRVIDIRKQGNEYFFSTIGDNNNGQLEAEKNINENQIVGKADFKLIPYAGWVKLVFFEPSKPASQRGFCSEN